jgi:hypothetical protein
MIGQSSLWLDAGVLGGQSILKIDNSSDDSRFQKKTGLDQLGFRSGLSFGVSDFIYFNFGGGFQRRGFTFSDQQTANFGIGDVFTTQYKVKQISTYGQFYFGFEKPLRPNQGNTPFVGLSGIYNVLSAGTVSNSQADLNWGSSQASFDFESTIVDKNVGIEPEFGFYLGASSKSRWKMSFLYHYGLSNQVLGGLSVSDGLGAVLSESTINSVGNYLMFKLAYQGRLW